MPKICMLRLPVARREGVGEDLGSDAVDRPNKVTVRNGSITCLERQNKTPSNQRMRERSHWNEENSG